MREPETDIPSSSKKCTVRSQSGDASTDLASTDDMLTTESVVDTVLQGEDDEYRGVDESATFSTTRTPSLSLGAFVDVFSGWLKKQIQDESPQTTMDADKAIRPVHRSIEFLSTTKEDLLQFQNAVDLLLSRSSTEQDAYSERSSSTNPHQYTRIPHCQQLDSWDCGIACVQMILRWLREDQVEGPIRKLTGSELMERDRMLEIIGTESVWTIDLVLLLEKIAGTRSHAADCKDVDDSLSLLGNEATLSYLFCSTHLGVDANYTGFGYYRHAFEDDQLRVNQLFQEAQEMQLPMLCVKHLGLSEVVSLVSLENCVAIVLVDNSILLDRKRMASMDRSKFAIPMWTTQVEIQDPSDAYMGHYIVLCGVSFNPVHVAQARARDPSDVCRRAEKEAYCLVIKDPAWSTAEEFISPFLFEKSRQADGTDEDIIFFAKS